MSLRCWSPPPTASAGQLFPPGKMTPTRSPCEEDLVESDQVRTSRFPVIRGRKHHTGESGCPIHASDSVAPAPPLVGIEAAQKRIEAALRNGESLVVVGPAGCGKTRLLQECCHAVPGTAFVEYRTNLHQFLQALATSLVEAGHDRIPFDVTRKTSVHLRGVLWNALEKRPGRLIVDGVDSASFPVLRFFQRIYFVRGMSIVVSARDGVALGALGRLFWDPRKTVQLSPLNDAASAELFTRAIEACGVRAANLDEFRRRTLDAAGGIGGQIVEMCRLAARPEYLTRSGRIKFELVRIDSLVRTVI